MSWFDRCRGEESAEEAQGRLAHLLETSGVDGVLARACGRRGLRRFVLRFEVRGGRIRFDPPDAAVLAEGGGPPPAFDPSALEAALLRMRGRLRRPWGFDRGALGVVRDGDGRLDLRVRFDEDATELPLTALRMPTGEPHPLEAPGYVRAVQDWSARMSALTWMAPTADWGWGDTLVVDGAPVAAALIAVWHNGHFDWMLDEPAGEEAPLCEPSLDVSLAESAELVALAAARLGCRAVFRGQSDRGETVFGGVP